MYVSPLLLLTLQADHAGKNLTHYNLCSCHQLILRLRCTYGEMSKSHMLIFIIPCICVDSINQPAEESLQPTLRCKHSCFCKHLLAHSWVEHWIGKQCFTTLPTFLSLLRLYCHVLWSSVHKVTDTCSPLTFVFLDCGRKSSCKSKAPCCLWETLHPA